MSFSKTVGDYAHLAHEHPKEAALAFLNMVPFVGAAVKEGASLLNGAHARRLAAAHRYEDARAFRQKAHEQQQMAVGLLCSSFYSLGGAWMAVSLHDKPGGVVLATLASCVSGSLTAVDFINLKEKTDALLPLGDARRPDYFIQPSRSSADRSQSR